MLWAVPVDANGALDYVATWCTEQIQRAGYGGVPITFKSDGEAIIVALKRTVPNRRVAATVPIEYPVRES